MTLVVALTLPDDVILGTDSAATYVDPDTGVSKIMPAADKLVGLAGRRIGVATYGPGNLGGRSIGNLLHEFQHTRGGPPAILTVGETAEELRAFFAPPYQQTIMQSPPCPPAGTPDDAIWNALSLQFVVAGYSPDVVFPEVWHVDIAGDNWPGEVTCIYEPGDFGSDSFSMDDPIFRYVSGYDRRLIADLKRLFPDMFGVQPPEDFEDRVREVLATYEQPVPYQLLPVEMGVAYVRSLITLAIDYYRFSLSEDVIGGQPRIGLVTYRDREFYLL